MRAWWAVSLSLVAGGCIEPRAFDCREGTCNLDGQVGRCEVEGYCSYPDQACPSGRRFESQAPEELRNNCVDGDNGTSTSSASTSTSSAEDTEPTGDASTTAAECDGHGCGWTSVDAGFAHACALDRNGAVWCWGGNRSGELGQDVAPEFSDVPQAPAGSLTGQTSVAAGGHTCALGPDALHCWGPNGQRQVDWRVAQASFTSPHRVVLEDTTVRSVSVGKNRTCVAAAERMLCWGGGESDIEASPVAPAPVQEVAVGLDHRCGLLDDASIWCLGDDFHGQLGGGTDDDTPGPVSVDLEGEGALRIAAGPRHTCAITDGDGPTARGIKCWGDNRQLQAGGVSSNESIDTPRDVSGSLPPAAWQEVAAGGSHTCAINDAGEVWCWGDNRFGQSDPSNVDAWTGTSARVEFDPPLVATDIAAAEVMTCAIDQSERWWCWGCLTPWILETNPDGCEVSPPTLLTSP